MAAGQGIGNAIKAFAMGPQVRQQAAQSQEAILAKIYADNMQGNQYGANARKLTADATDQEMTTRLREGVDAELAANPSMPAYERALRMGFKFAGPQHMQNWSAAAVNEKKIADLNAIQANPELAQATGIAYGATKGELPFTAVNDGGHSFNRYTGNTTEANPVLAKLFGDKRQSEIAENKAQANSANASARKTTQDIEQSIRTGDLQVVNGADGAITVVNKRTMTAQPVLDAQGRTVQAGAAAAKPLTEQQAKANLFGARMYEANKILNELEDAKVMRPGAIKGSAETVGRILGLGTDSMGGTLADAAGSMTNWTQSKSQQRVEQARRDFVNAVLRKESGAVISPQEFANAEKQYFPQPGDSKAVIEQKRKNRELAMNMMLKEVPDAQRYRPGASPAVSTPPAPADSGAGETTPAASGWSIRRID
ncbi:hypothetical protein B9Z34_09525 [Limnohabitans sp. Hippo3]|nr:hypothetical protein B9Z34_09525 [Limnohabitans sp. Hippo3]